MANLVPNTNVPGISGGNVGNLLRAYDQESKGFAALTNTISDIQSREQDKLNSEYLKTVIAGGDVNDKKFAGVDAGVLAKGVTLQSTIAGDKRQKEKDLQDDILLGNKLNRQEIEYDRADKEYNKKIADEKAKQALSKAVLGVGNTQVVPAVKGNAGTVADQIKYNKNVSDAGYNTTKQASDKYTKLLKKYSSETVDRGSDAKSRIKASIDRVQNDNTILPDKKAVIINNLESAYFKAGSGDRTQVPKYTNEQAEQQALIDSGVLASADKVEPLIAVDKLVESAKATTRKSTPTELKQDKMNAIKALVDAGTIEPSVGLSAINELNKPKSTADKNYELNVAKHQETVRDNKEKNKIAAAKANKQLGSGNASTITALSGTGVDPELWGKFKTLRETYNLSDKEFAVMVESADTGIPWYGAPTDEWQYNNIKTMLGK